MVDWDLIARHLPDMLRVVLSVKAGLLTPSTLLRRLNSANAQSRVYRAFRELGRAVRTGVQLLCLSDVELRQTMQAAMNKNEAFNRFARWVSFGSGGVLTENNREEQLKLIKYNHLLANCLIFYNTSMITHTLHELANEGHTIPAEAIAGLSPYVTRHIDRFGQYEIDRERQAPLVTYDLPTALKRVSDDREIGNSPPL